MYSSAFLMEKFAEIGITVALQVGALVWFLSGVKSDLKNLIERVKTIDERGEATALKTAEMQGSIKALPCASCAPRLGA